jgi:7,8-dihydropterin-6-yl-methyl-4-(beta-D-ribofuranosyl)aminobenzene 5'-phosphate synthase
MKIKILFENVSADNRFLTGWGLSYLADEKILFDTGGDPDVLRGNMKNMGVKVFDIETVIISHDHWDHTGGLWGILKEKKGLEVYVCPDFNGLFKDRVRDLRGRIVETDKISEIKKNIFVTGEVGGIYKGRYMPEQALIIKRKEGLNVITGCAHPGILEILKRVKEGFPQQKIRFVFGGFHLKDNNEEEINNIIDEFEKIGVKKAGPAHCSGESARAAFKKRYGKNFISITAGGILEI